jgi:beta-lactamase regulating signal transducer with metallopeptidase domain
MSTSGSLESLVAALLHSLWQGGAAFLFAAAGLWLVPARKAQLRYTLCLAALAGVLLSCVATWAVLDVKAAAKARAGQDVTSFTEVSLSGRAELPLAGAEGAPGGSREGGGLSATVSRASSSPRVAELPEPTARYLYLPMLRLPAIAVREWTGWIAGAWLCGVVLFLVRMARDLLGANRLRNDAGEVTAQFLAMAGELIRKMGLERRLAAVRFLVSTHISVPAVIGFVRPTVLIPASMLLGVPQDYLRAVLAHEFAHIARWDYAASIAQRVVEALLFFNPFVWWISRQIRKEREACCDALAAACCETRTVYLEALLTCAGNAAGQAPLPAAALAADGGEKTLVDRARRLLLSGYRPALRVPWPTLVGILGAGAITLAVLAAGAHAAADVLTAKERIERILEVQKQVAPEEPRDGSIRLSGSFDTEDGRPLPHDATVRISGFSFSMERPAEAFDETIYPQVNTSRPEKLFISVWAPGYAPVFAGPFPANKDLKDLHLTLPKGFDVAIRVTGSNGEPIEGAQVKGYYEGPPDLTGEISAVTGTGGIAPIHAAGTEKVTLEVSAKGCASAVLTHAVFGKEALSFVLEKQEPVIGRVVAAESGQPLPGAIVKLLAIQGPFEENYGPDDAPTVAVADARGEFKLDETLKGADYSFIIEAGDRRANAIWPCGAAKGAHGDERDGGPYVVTARGDRSEPLEIEVPPPIVISGTVIASGSATSELHLHCMQTLHYAENGSLDSTQAANVTFKDGKGSFRFSKLFPTDAVLAVGNKTLLEINPLMSSQTGLSVDFGGPSTREVVVRFDWPKDGAEPNGTVRAIGDLEPDLGDGVPVKNGEARFKVRVPSTLTLQAKGLVGYWFGETDELPVNSGPGPMEIRIPLVPAGAVYGTLTGVPPVEGWAPGVVIKPLRAAPDDNQFQSWHAEVKLAPDGTEGSYRFVGTPVPLGGDYIALAEVGHCFAQSAPFHIDEKTPIQSVRIQMPEGVTVRRRFLDPEGRPMSGLDTELFYSGAEGVKSNTRCPRTDSDGWLVLPHLNPAGDYRLLLGSRSTYVTERWLLDWKQPEQEIRLRYGNSLSGVVLDADTGQPVADLSLLARLKQPLPQGEVTGFQPEAPTDAMGRFRFTDLPDGEFLVRSMTWGYDDAGKPATVHSGQKEPVVLKVREVEESGTPKSSPTPHAAAPTS